LPPSRIQQDRFHTATGRLSAVPENDYPGAIVLVGDGSKIGRVKSMPSFNLRSLMTESEAASQRWREFLRMPSLSMGIYRLQAGQADEQQPHTEDEVYLVLSGKASFRAGGQQQSVGPGSLIFVERVLEHRFVDITEDLQVLVFFAPPEGSLRAG
jgi:mannose-6-phosphate isomerase-like protein (cupin superfamily)